jgi:hypothetical protein
MVSEKASTTALPLRRPVPRTDVKAPRPAPGEMRLLSEGEARMSLEGARGSRFELSPWLNQKRDAERGERSRVSRFIIIDFQKRLAMSGRLLPLFKHDQVTVAYALRGVRTLAK